VGKGSPGCSCLSSDKSSAPPLSLLTRGRLPFLTFFIVKKGMVFFRLEVSG
jgi:hypothetical protein